MAKNWYAEVKWADPEAEGRDWRRSDQNGRQTGNQETSTELPHGLAPWNVDGKVTLTEPVSSVREALQEDVRNHFDGLTHVTPDISRCFADPRDTNKVMSGRVRTQPLAWLIRNPRHR